MSRRPARRLLLTGSRGGGFTPASLAPALWLTAGPTWCFQDAGATTPCGDGDPVRVWLDRSGNLRHFTQATSAFRPTLMLESGKWVVSFDGSDDLLSGNAAALGLARNVAGMTAVIGRKWNPLSVVNGRRIDPLYAAMGAGSGSRFSVAVTANGTAAQFAGGGRTLDGGAFDGPTPAGSDGGGWLVQSSRADYANARWDNWVNGTLVNSDTSFSTAGSTSDTDSTQVNVGREGTTIYSALRVAVAVACRAALPPADRAALEAYAAALLPTP